MTRCECVRYRDFSNDAAPGAGRGVPLPGQALPDQPAGDASRGIEIANEVRKERGWRPVEDRKAAPRPLPPGSEN